MNKIVIIYLHGFNSASLNINGNLLTNKEKLLIMQEFCNQNEIEFYTPNVDYRDFQNLIEDILFEWNQYLDRGYKVTFMGSSMGGFACEYLAMKTGCHAIMINPAIKPSELLKQFIGVTKNFETNLPYHWENHHCEQYLKYEQELADNHKAIDRTILLDKADELIDAATTFTKYQAIANVVSFDGGSHGFEHMRQALPIIKQLLC
ncbi:MAG: hypothetical protein NTY69_07840 [Methylococcales bacterium]|nr:hypothetical protein [Methylococcales bacterium]